MGLRVVGAGVGRTGTESLKMALEQLLDGRCYHMLELLQRPEAFAYWAAASRDEMPDWDEVFADFVACVDWPAAAFWPEISTAYPDALVILSVRNSADEWFRSASDTIFRFMPGTGNLPAALDDNMETFVGMMKRFTTDVQDPVVAKAAYEAHNARVRETIPADRLLEWRPGDGWGQICAALELPVP